MSELLSLADLAGAAVENVAEVRFETMAIGMYGFECTAASLVEIGNDNKPCAKFKLEVKEVMNSESPKTPEELVGKSHTETIFIDRDSPEEGIGRIKAFIADANGDNSGVMGGVVGATNEAGELINGFIDRFKGHQFTGGIKHRKNPNDKDNPYANVFFPKTAAADAEV